MWEGGRQRIIENIWEAEKDRDLMKNGENREDEEILTKKRIGSHAKKEKKS